MERVIATREFLERLPVIGDLYSSLLRELLRDHRWSYFKNNFLVLEIEKQLGIQGIYGFSCFSLFQGT